MCIASRKFLILLSNSSFLAGKRCLLSVLIVSLVEQQFGELEVPSSTLACVSRFSFLAKTSLRYQCTRLGVLCSDRDAAATEFEKFVLMNHFIYFFIPPHIFARCSFRFK